MALAEVWQVSTLVALGLVPRAAPPASVAVRIDFDAPARCSDAKAFYAGLSARMDHVKRAAPGESATRLEVRLARVGKNVHGELRIVDQRSASDIRKVDGTSCEQVVEALSLTAALALDQLAHAAPPPFATVSPPETASPGVPPAPPPRTASSGVPPPTPPKTASSSVPPAPPPKTASSSVPPPTHRDPASPAAPPPRVVPEPLPTALEPASAANPGTGDVLASRSSSSIAFDVGARALAANAASPGLGVGGAIFLRIALRRANGARPSIAITALHAPNDVLQSNDVVIRWTAVVMTACPGWAIGRVIALEACAQASGGWLSANDRGITNPGPAVGRWWGNAGLAGHAWMPLFTRFVLDVEGSLGVPLVHRRFVTSTPERVVAETPRISALLGVGIAYTF